MQRQRQSAHVLAGIQSLANALGKRQVVSDNNIVCFPVLLKFLITVFIFYFAGSPLLSSFLWWQEL